MLAKMGLLAIGGILILIGIIIGVSAVGYLVYSEFINHPRYNVETGQIEDSFGRTMTPAPWFVTKVLPFLTDPFALSPEQQIINKATGSPTGSSQRYWLGLWWTLLDWIGVIVIFCIVYGIGAGGLALIGVGMDRPTKSKAEGASDE